MTPGRRGLTVAVGLCLLGSLLVLVTVSRTWVEVVVLRGAVLPETTVGVRGADLVTGLRAVALVGLAGVLALLATRRTGRLLVGALLALCGAAVVALVVRVLGRLEREAVLTERVLALSPVGVRADPSPTAWPLLCLAGGVLLAATGVLVAVRGRRWAEMSPRYDSPAARAPEPAADAGERAVWEALDRGEDPTAASPGNGHDARRD